MVFVKLNVVYVNYKSQKMLYKNLLLETTDKFNIDLKNMFSSGKDYCRILDLSKKIEYTNNNKIKIFLKKNQEDCYEKKWYKEELFNYIFSSLFLESDVEDIDNPIINYDNDHLKRCFLKNNNSYINLTVNIHVNNSLKKWIEMNK